MQATALRTGVAVEAYLALERDAEEKHEYHEGFVIGMAGASPEHGLITLNIGAELRRQLRPEGCQTFVADLRVQTGRAYTYPDVVCVCEAPHFSGDQPPSLLNPTLLVEVTSESTSERNHTWKLDVYTQIDSVREYWIVEQERPFVTRYVRREEHWAVYFIRGLDADVASDDLGVTVPMHEVYAQVEGPSAEAS